MAQYIYVIGLQRRGRNIIGPCKIGVSNKPLERVRTMQTGNHHPLALVLSLQTPDAAKLESRVHAWLENMGVERRGEWFMLSPSEAVHVVFKHHVLDIRLGDEPESWPQIAKNDVKYFDGRFVEIDPKYSAVRWAI